MRFLSLLFAATCALWAPEAQAYQEQSLCAYFTVGDADEQVYIGWPHKGVWEITDVVFAPMTAVADNATNNHVFTVAINAGTASTTWTTIGTWTTDTDDSETPHVVGTIIDVTLTKPTTIQRGYQIRLSNANGGTGPAADGHLCVSARKV